MNWVQWLVKFGRKLLQMAVGEKRLEYRPAGALHGEKEGSVFEKWWKVAQGQSFLADQYNLKIIYLEYIRS